ncbi:MAG TPA: hypothetical protein VFF13_01635 [archaeon]|nr:hypothetical protein [archaeon]
MNVAIIAEQDNDDVKKLIAAFKTKKMASEFIEAGNIGIYIQKNASKIFLDKKNFSQYDAAFVSLPLTFTPFAEPFLSELVDEGIYCQLKPNSYYLLSNKPFLYSTLSSKGVKTPQTDILADKESVDYSLKEFTYPIIVKTFLGLKKTNSVLVESDRSLKSFIKSISLNIDAITIQTHLEGNVDQSLVVGDDVYTVKRKWIEEELSHSKKAINTRLADHDKETAIKAAKVSGMDVGVVKMINGNVIGVRNSVDFKLFNDALSQNMYEKVAQHYSEKMRGEK